MTEFEIKKDVPLPERGGQGVSKYPFSKLKVGECFDVGIDQSPSMLNSVRGAAYQAGKRYNMKYVTRTLKGEGGKLFVRVWRKS